MTDDAQTGETGQPGESAESSTAAETTQTTGETETVETSAGTETTETETHTVPSHRLREEADKRREAERQLVEVTTRLDALEQRGTAAMSEAQNGATTTETEDPPAHITDARARAKWIVEHDTKDYIERELGMSLSNAKTVLTASVGSLQDNAKRTWESGCKRHGLDSGNKEVVRFCNGLVKAGDFSLEEAFSRAAKAFGTSPTTETTTGASVETTSQTGAMSRERVVPKNAKHALELAEKGVTIAHTSMDELIRSTVDEELKHIGPQRVRTLQG